MDIFAKYLTKGYNTVMVVPRWILFIISGSTASLIIAVLHRSPKKKAPAAVKRESVPQGQQQAKATLSVPSTATGTSIPTTRSKSKAPATDSEREGSAPPGTRSSARQRKGRK